jgi:hypothetical protein
VIVGDVVGSSRRLELWHLLLDRVGGCVVWSGEDERDRFGGEVAAADEPFVILLDAEHSGQADQAAVVGEDADDVGAAADFFVEALERVGDRYERR